MDYGLIQTPSPDSKILTFCGQTITFELKTPAELEGKAYLRTNLGKANIRRSEIIKSAENELLPSGRDWWDIEMVKVDQGLYRLTLGLVQTGCFAAKTLFIKPDGKVAWPHGENVLIKTEPDDTFCQNTIYTVFPRQFGELAKNKSQNNHTEYTDTISRLDELGYTVIPPSGTFADVAKELDFIIDELGFRIIQLLPVHPTPTVFMRMGRFGSPFAATDFFNVDPLMATQIQDATVMEQFVEFVDQVHLRDAKVFMDLPANHTGWSSYLQNHHPNWFKREKNGKFISPGAWGVVWEDLCELDYDNKELQDYMAEVFLYWAEQGVDGFRCDAGYMLPIKAWDYIVAKVRDEFPDTIFMLEGLGGKLSVTEKLLSHSGLNWAYSELFQNYSPEQITGYLPYANSVSQTIGTLVHFAETHDNNRLAQNGKDYAKMRTAMCAMFSCAGAFGVTNGVEWFAGEKVDVHGASGLNWSSEDNQIHLIKRINRILRNHPCFFAGAKLRFIHTCHNRSMAMLRESEAEKVLVAVNTDVENDSSISWKADFFAPMNDQCVFNLLTDEKINFSADGDEISIMLGKGEVAVLVQSQQQLDEFNNNINGDVLRKQTFAATVLSAILKVKGFSDLSGFDIEALTELFAERTDEFFSQICGSSGYVPLVRWNYPEDKHREVMLPVNHFMQICANKPFRVSLVAGDGKVIQTGKSVLLNNDTFAVIFDSFDLEVNGSANYKLVFKVYDRKKIDCFTSGIKILGSGSDSLCIDLCARDIIKADHYALCCNHLGAIAQVRARWASLCSKYDAILAANLNPTYPVDRHIMLTRIRGWVVYRDYSSELSGEFQTSFTTDMNNKVSWRFDVPVGMGKDIPLAITLNFDKTGNAADIVFTRLAANCPNCLDNNEVVKLVIRPDIEDRCNHEVTKAYKGPEYHFPASISSFDNGFTFSPAFERTLVVTSENSGKFINEPQWEYMAGLPVEAQRGLESQTDLFSPGYFKFKLAAGKSAVLRASITTPRAERHDGKIDYMPVAVGKKWDIKELLAKAMSFYMVDRSAYKTVIAGYPWFLDWGRDTFIALRGLISAGLGEDCRRIINQFARYEENGTLPNMISGSDVSNRDTTDAPLWLFTAVNDYIAATNDKSILEDDCNGRELLDVLISIAEAYIKGTNNGIIADPQTMLIFSPAHFTWMDTNYPAATPREGYPIEVQALWFAALDFLYRYDIINEDKWRDIRLKVRENTYRLFVSKDSIGLSDCLHAQRGTCADEAAKDDALRPNQLFAITLGLIEDKQLAKTILNACSSLLIPGSIRSLADRELNHPLAVYKDGNLLNDPLRPYKGVYGGDEDTSRKPAYHNGTAWGWVFPSYCEAMLEIYGSEAVAPAKSIMLSITEMLKTGCIGHLPEICDGNSPHSQRGCQAQAWSVCEAYRVLKMLG